MKSGFVAVMGKPNVGKSTLINRILGRSLLITSPKPQTTRNRILAVAHLEHGQIIFLDTPGLHQPKDKLGEYMVKVAVETLQMDIDLALWLTEPHHLDDSLKEIEEVLKETKFPEEKVILAINKIDLLDIKAIEKLQKMQVPYDKYLISALTGEGVDRLIEGMLAKLPEGPPYYPEEIFTDRPEAFVVAEFIREAAIRNLHQELPYSVAVVVDEIEEKEDITYVKAYIFVERETQKAIVIGRGGEMLKKIGTEARRRAEAFFGKRYYLDIWVKVRKKWRKKAPYLRQLGFNETSLT